jgi:acyl-CoA thioesterase I
LLSQDKPITWSFTGDSVTAGVGHLRGHRDYTQLFAERVRYEIHRYRDVVVNTAVGGSTVDDVADDLEHRVLRFRPDVVIMAPVSTTPETREPTSKTSAPAISRSSKTAKTPSLSRRRADLTLVDHAEIWRQAEERGIVEAWISQGCHPNLYGHRAMATPCSAPSACSPRTGSSAG